MKNNTKKIVLSIVAVIIFVACAVAGVLVHQYYTTGNGAYNREIEYKYEQVFEDLEKRLEKDCLNGSFPDLKISHIKFEDVNEETGTSNVNIYYEGTHFLRKTWNQGIATYNVIAKYYNALVDAEESDNMLIYLDCLNEIFDNMEFVKNNYDVKLDFFKFTYYSVEEINECHRNANELLSLEVDYPGINRQVGFLPYNIEVLHYELDTENKKEYYTYKISGVSYCEVEEGGGEEIPLEEKDLLLDKSYNSKQIKTFYRDFTFTSSRSYDEYPSTTESCLWGDINAVWENVKEEEIIIKTTFFEEESLFDNFKTMQEGAFKFKKPKDFDLREYLK